jgi:hypothetical protein
VRDTFEAAGLSLVSLDLISQTIAPDWDIYADKIAANADSVLARLTRADFAGGLAALRQYAVVAQHDAVIEPIDLFVFSA